MAQLIQTREAAKRRVNAKSDFLAMMSHELRLSMNGVLGMLQLLETTGDDRGAGRIRRPRLRVHRTPAESHQRHPRLLAHRTFLELELEHIPFNLAELIAPARSRSSTARHGGAGWR